MKNPVEFESPSREKGLDETQEMDRQGEVADCAVAGEIDLTATPLSFGAASYEHSAEFNSTFLLRRSYWSQILSTLGLPSSGVN